MERKRPSEMTSEEALILFHNTTSKLRVVLARGEEETEQEFRDRFEVAILEELGNYVVDPIELKQMAVGEAYRMLHVVNTHRPRPFDWPDFRDHVVYVAGIPLLTFLTAWYTTELIDYALHKVGVRKKKE